MRNPNGMTNRGRLSRRAALAAGLAGVAGTWSLNAQAADPGTKPLRAGAVKVDITPEKLPVIVNGSMTERTTDVVTDRLHVRCLVLDDGTERIALAVVDNCVLPRDLVDAAKALAEEATGIRADRIMISATHSHSTPSVMAVLGSGRNEEYAAWLPGRIAEAIGNAADRLMPARIGWGVGREPKNIFCRRWLMKPGTAATNRFSGKRDDRVQMNPGYQNPNAIERTGPVDNSVSLLSVQSLTGKPLALLGNYSTHYVGAPGLSADYFGVFCTRIGELIGAGPGFVGLLSNGTSGDANCCDFANPARKYDRFSVAEDVAQAALQAYREIRYFDWTPLAMEETRLTLGIRTPKPDEIAQAQEFLRKLGDRKPRSVEEVYAAETLIMSKMPPQRELKLQAIRIGGMAIAAFPCEVFGVTGLRLKRRSPLQPTLNIELANGYDGYLPPPEQHDLGGYETWRARSSCLEESAEPQIVAAMLQLLNTVASRRADQKPIASRS